jgi:ribosomal protein S18 acetylase RimI-like enzyme
MNFQIVPYQKKTHSQGWAKALAQAWKETYQGLMDTHALASMDESVFFRIAMTKIVEGQEFVAIRKGSVIGLAGFVPAAPEDPDKAAITGLYVLKRYQRQGVGTALLSTCLSFLKGKKIVLYVLDSNQNAIDFYEHRGWRKTGIGKTERIGGALISEEQMAYDADALPPL